MISRSKIIAVTVKIVVNLLYVASILFLLWIFCLVFVYASFTIPTNSMQPTIKPGDMVFVDKIATGSRLFDILGAASGDTVSIFRMPGWRNFKRDDVLVFNFVHRDSWDTIAMNLRTYYIKRCIGLPGDTVSISDFRYIVGGDTLTRYPSTEEFTRYYPDDSALCADRVRGYMADLSDTIDNWTIRNFGPLIIPASGMTLPVDTVTFRRYRQIMERETGRKIRLADGTVWLGNKPIDSYTFKENYYFMAGDNALGSMDSRYWGLVPEEFIVGRAGLIIWSKNSNGIQWKRIFKRVK